MFKMLSKNRKQHTKVRIQSKKKPYYTTKLEDSAMSEVITYRSSGKMKKRYGI